MNIYNWDTYDKAKYIIVAITWLAATGIGVYSVFLYKPLFLLMYLFSYLMLVYFQARFYCIGCPYKGSFCPGILNMTFANFLADKLYAKKIFSEKRCLQFEPLMLFLTAFYIGLPVVFMWSNRMLVVLYLGLFLAHFLLEFLLFCPKCSFRKICPGGKFAVRVFGERGEQR
jgi:hypothetical protein